MQTLRPPDHPGRVIRESRGSVVWQGGARDAEGEAVRLNRATDGGESFRPEEMDDAGIWHHMRFRLGGRKPFRYGMA
jgi:hypothetical protein